MYRKTYENIEKTTLNGLLPYLVLDIISKNEGTTGYLIHRAVNSLVTGCNIDNNRIYAILEQYQRRKYVNYWHSKTTGNRRRVHYRLTNEGLLYRVRLLGIIKGLTK